ncbi:MAG: molybdopterin-dependent oxidoreductase [Rhodospirillaceae bacterium]|nr:molybdopterin-dependent oxidoreductase [Rhodospirillaceae bacterium]
MLGKLKVAAAVAVLYALCGAAGADAGTAYEDAYQVTSAGTLKPGQPLPTPQGDVVLTVTGKIGAEPNTPAGVAFDMATLERIGLIRFTTKTEWTDGPIQFEGVLLKDLLAVLHPDKGADKLVLRALNDYVSSMPISDAEDYPVMVAIKENGEYMSVRERGPLWIVYPEDAFPEVGRREFLSRWVWQLAEISVE